MLQGVFATVAEAVGDMTRVYATTARVRGETRKEVMDLRTAAAGAVLVATGEAGGKAGIMFGPEASGLSNADLAFADVLVQIPTNPYFASLNLAQAVGLVACECYASLHASSSAITASPNRLDEDKGDASKGHVETLSLRLEAALERVQYQPDPNMRSGLFEKLREILWRSKPSSNEIAMLHGVLTCLHPGEGNKRNAIGPPSAQDPPC